MVGRVVSELQIQAGLRSRCRNWAPAISLVAVPNAGKRGQRALNQALKEGLAIGFPDLIALAPGGLVAFIEVKRADGKTTPRQDDWHEALRRWGFACAVIRSIDEGEAFLRAQGFPWLEGQDSNGPGGARDACPALNIGQQEWLNV